ncbi:MAG: peptide chain release factor N(5)-glutamine methyltransferase [Gemmatimonadaceae bacterium]
MGDAALSLTWRQLLTQVAAQLADAAALEPDVRADAQREARLLVAGVQDWSPGQLAHQIDAVAPASAVPHVAAATARRVRGEPLAYAVGTAAFRHLTLQVDARVLIPRPETEVVVGEALAATADRPGGIAVDIGTGSGAIALALATEGRFDRVIATDISADALEVARANAEAIGGATPVEFRMGADLAPIHGVRARVLVSNPPYISFEEAAALPASVRDWEPATALYAADEGMARYAALLAGAADLLEPDGVLVLEVDANRAAATAALAVSAGWRVERLVQDLSGRDRVLVVRPARTPGAFPHDAQ